MRWENHRHRPKLPHTPAKAHHKRNAERAPSLPIQITANAGSTRTKCVTSHFLREAVFTVGNFAHIAVATVFLSEDDSKRMSTRRLRRDPLSTGRVDFLGPASTSCQKWGRHGTRREGNKDCTIMNERGLLGQPLPQAHGVLMKLEVLQQHEAINSAPPFRKGGRLTMHISRCST